MFPATSHYHLRCGGRQIRTARSYFVLRVVVMWQPVFTRIVRLDSVLPEHLQYGTMEITMKGYRPSQFGEKITESFETPYCAFISQNGEPCGALRLVTYYMHKGVKKVKSRRKYCPAHMKQMQRYGEENLKPLRWRKKR